MENCSFEFDNKFDAIEHYQIYPEMKPWVGSEYTHSKVKILVIGESHYLDAGSIYHHDTQGWYEGVKVSDKKDWGWIKTRNIISNGINTKWKDKSKAIYRNIEKALFETELYKEKQLTVFSDIAFLNYFQRPAQQTGKSIKVSKLDSDISNKVVSQVVTTISPDIVIFTSSLAWRHAKRSGFVKVLDDSLIKCTRAPHPGMPWWNRVSKMYGNRTGKQHFINFVNTSVKINS